MAQVSFQKVKKVYPNGVVAVDDFSLNIVDREFIVLVGPSGCGKSTTLRMLAGLEAITEGSLYIDGELVNDIEPKDRNIAMVFQSYALYPHMTAQQNMALGLELRKTDKAIIKERIHTAAKVLGIEGLLQRRPAQLSGGEKQRVALGRAMVREPRVFLLDEPLSNLDAKLRNHMRIELIGLHNRLQTTFVYVTHDQVEAMTMGDRIVIMDKGRIQQVGTPQSLYDHPRNLFVAGFLGTPQINLVDCVLERRDGGFLARLDSGELMVDMIRYSGDVLEPLIGRALVLGIRPESIRAYPDGDEICEFSTLTAQVELCEQIGSEAYLHLRFGETRLVSKTPVREALQAGQAATLHVDMAQTHLFDKTSGAVVG